MIVPRSIFNTTRVICNLGLSILKSSNSTGQGYNGKFVSNTQYYWFYGGTGPGDNRSVQWQHLASQGNVAPWDGKTTITTEYIRGNGSNGGETPGQDLTLKFWTQNTGWVDAGAVWEYSTASFNNDVGIDWSTTTLNIPTSIQTEITAGNDFWMKYEQLNIQQNGADSSPGVDVVGSESASTNCCAL